MGDGEDKIKGRSGISLSWVLPAIVGVNTACKHLAGQGNDANDATSSDILLQY